MTDRPPVVSYRFEAWTAKPSAQTWAKVQTITDRDLTAAKTVEPSTDLVRLVEKRDDQQREADARMERMRAEIDAARREGVI